jgi:hypothetical protein
LLARTLLLLRILKVTSAWFDDWLNEFPKTTFLLTTWPLMVISRTVDVALAIGVKVNDPLPLETVETPVAATTETFLAKAGVVPLIL